MARWLCLVLIAVALAQFSRTARAQCVEFRPASSNPSGGSRRPLALATGDFNADGKLDLVVSNFTFGTTNNISVLLGNGDGTFGAAVDYSANGGQPQFIAVGDVNGDGKQDLAVANSGTNNVSIFLGRGDGTFASAVTYAAGSGPSAVAIRDLNGDGLPDLAVTDGASNEVSVLLGNGDGTFGSPSRYSTGATPKSIAVVDVNHDGKADLAVANFNGTVSILLGHGDGSFDNAKEYPTRDGSQSIAVGDFNGDGNIDLAVADINGLFGSDISVLLGNGDGTFAPAVSYTGEPNVNSIAVADFNGDGKLDLAVANQFSSSVSVLLGNGDGTFAPRLTFGAEVTPNSIVVGDFDGDGRPDIAVANLNIGVVSILLNRNCSTPDLAVTKTHDGFFVQGEKAKTYAIGVSNVGVAATTGTVTLVERPTGGLSVSSMQGDGWTCNGATMTCTRTDALQAGESYPPITVVVDVDVFASSVLTNTAIVSGGGELNTGNDVARDPTIIIGARRRAAR